LNLSAFDGFIFLLIADGINNITNATIEVPSDMETISSNSILTGAT
jgi:hypothetical protein